MNPLIRIFWLPALLFLFQNTWGQGLSSEEFDGPAFKISGAVDAYYQYNFNHHPHPVNFVEKHNSFAPGAANIIFSKEGKFGFTADLAAGPRSENIIGYSGNTLALVKQLFISYQATDAVKFTLGSFGTYIGYETIEATGNLNYSSSYQFSNGPFYQSGLKVDFTLSEKFGAMVGIFNDTDRHIDEVSGKHLGGQLSFDDGRLSANLNYLRGKEDDSDPQDELFGNQVDLTARYEVTDAFGLGLNATLKHLSAERSGNSSWFGAALYAHYDFNETFTLALRAGHIGDSDGIITGTPDTGIETFTLSGNVHLGPIRLVPEFRVDVASNDVFLDADERPAGTNTAVVLGVIYAF